MKILIVDDDSIQRDLLRGFIEKQGYDVDTAEDGPSALAAYEQTAYGLILLDHNMPGMHGDELLERIKAINPFVRCIMITAYGTVETAVAVMKLGADDFLEKPVDLKHLQEKIAWIDQALMIQEDVEAVAEEMVAAELPIRLIGESPAMKDAVSMIRRIAPSDWSVLIRGETGTGKELVARLIHLLSPRQEQPFIEVNCAALPETLFESELFGHEKGAFTGASNRRKGRFELADGGTVFLDEIGEMPLPMQAKLLRVLQEKRVTRVGGEKDFTVDVRVLAATNRNLRACVADGSFREDLYYRLNVFDMELPPLRNRKVDIPELITFFMEKYAPQPVRMDPEAIAALVRYSFPGNVRELEHLIQRMVTLTRGRIITVRELPPEVRFYQAADGGTLEQRLTAVELEMIQSALEASDWVQTRAAESLGISERVLRYKMKKHGIKR